MKLRALSLLLLVTFCLLSCSDSSAGEVTLVYTGSTHAMLSPCNCPIEADGGVARRATLVKQLRKSNPYMLLLDSGNFFSAGPLDHNTQNAQLDMRRAIVNLKAMELMKYDALNLSDDEFNFGEKFFEENAGEVKLKFLSANIQSAKVLPYLIKEVAGIKFGIIGLANTNAKGKLKDLKFIEPKPALKSAMLKLKESQTDIVILLSNLTEAENIELINAVPGIDVVIEGYGLSEKGPSSKAGSTVILRPVWQGRKLSKAALQVSGKKIIDVKVEEIRVSDKVSDDKEVSAVLPHCFSDTDCKKEGFIGSCQDAGSLKARCLFKEALKIKLTVVMPKDCSTCNPDPVVKFLKEQFPGLQITYLYYPQQKALNLVKKLKIWWLPVYLLDKEAEKEQGFSDLKARLEDKGDSYILKPDASGIAYFLNRERIKGNLDIFISLYDKNVPELLGAVRSFNPDIHFLVIAADDGFDAPKGAAEIEESLRAVCVKKYCPQAFLEYISCRAKNISSSWWEDCLGELDTEKIRLCAKGGEGVSLLKKNIKLNSELKIMFGPTYLLDNQEIFSSMGVPSEEEFKKIIKR